MLKSLGRKAANLLRAIVLTSVAVVTLLGVFVVLDRLLLPDESSRAS